MPFSIALDHRALLGEGPLWHPDEQVLYWLDYLRGEVHRFDPATGRDAIVYAGPRVSGLTAQADGGLLLLAEGARVVAWRDGVGRVVVEEFPGSAGMHFNDAIADAAGRVLSGTVPDDPSRYADCVGVLYRIERDGRVVPICDGVGIANGLGFSPGGERLYLTDTLTRQIHAFDYDVASGRATNRRIFVDLSQEPGAPDGLAVDRAGFVWSARWEGGAVHRHAPDGREDRRIELPAHRITSVAFGGPELAELYVTSARGDDPSGQAAAAEGPAAGALFRVATGVRGLPEHCSRIGR